jgi:hypothetical protein
MASFFVRKESYGWRVLQETWKDGKRTQSTVPDLVYSELGFNKSWTVDQAKNHCKELNKRKAYERKKQYSVTAIAKRVSDIKDVESAYLPDILQDGFIEKIKDSSFGSETHVKRLLSHWKTACVLIRDLKIDVSQFRKHQDRVYKYIADKQYSPDYCGKLIRMLNMWGTFVSEHRSTGYSPIERPTGIKKSSIADAYIDSDDYVGESDPLTPELLRGVELPSPEQKNWLSITVWFGLRPLETDNLVKPGTWRIETLKDVQILWVYQSKLRNLSRDKRWKGIPCIFKEQIQLLEVIKSGAIKRPILKTLTKSLGTDKITLYGGRKGFIDLMLDRGQKLEDISMWLGHQSIEITWKKYRNKKRVSYTKAG